MNNLIPAIRASLSAKLERLLSRPIIAAIDGKESDERANSVAPFAFNIMRQAARAVAPVGSKSPWRENPAEGTWSVAIEIDYDDLWKGHEKEVHQAICGTVEQQVTFLTKQQRQLLERAPREFLALNPKPESAELVSFEPEDNSGASRVVELTVSGRPSDIDEITSVAIVPNLVQIERQLSALEVLEAQPQGSLLWPLRALVGLEDVNAAPTPSERIAAEIGEAPAKIDQYQRECITLALSSPHFTVIHGPPGSGKTTVISEIVRQCVDAGERILIVSPTHVAVDNVVAKLVPDPDRKEVDALDPRTIPVRFASRKKNLSNVALDYWVSAKMQKRATTVSSRVERVLRAKIQDAGRLFDAVDTANSVGAPLSQAIAECEQVICGTPIGMLSYSAVKDAAAGSFDLLIVDEVSKMTLPEFLAIAVKARRWVLVGDPEQLPPFSSAADNSVTLDDVIEPGLELACSVVNFYFKTSSKFRATTPLVVVARVPQRTATVIGEQITAAQKDCPSLWNTPPIRVFNTQANAGSPAVVRAEILVCLPSEARAAMLHASLMTPTNPAGHAGADRNCSDLKILLERCVPLQRPAISESARLLEAEQRSQAAIFENAFNVFHARPWTKWNQQILKSVADLGFLTRCIPSASAIQALRPVSEDCQKRDDPRARMMRAIAQRIAINAMSVFDWLTGADPESFDVPLLNEVPAILPRALIEAVAPFVGRLKKQYRMHSSLSRVPRKLFYHDQALLDGRADDGPGSRVELVQVESARDGERNAEEAQKTWDMLEQLNNQVTAGSAERTGIMIITPYRAHEALLNERFADHETKLPALDLEICTLDRCQGREKDYVFINLVRSKASSFMDMPKRWNVALTRAKLGLFIVGNIQAYLNEARMARRAGVREATGWTQMSLIARCLEEYARRQ